MRRIIETLATRQSGMYLGPRRRTYQIAGQTLLIAAFLLSQCILSGCESGKDNKQHSADAHGGLHLRLETDFSRSDYVLGETVIVRMYLKNTTKKDIVISTWPSREELIFTHYEDNRPMVYKDAAVFDRPVSKEKAFISVKCGQEIPYATTQFGEEFQEEFGGKYFDKIGRWELKIIHFHDFTGERFGLNAWQGKLSSTVLSINISSQK